jgi:aryl-alcohol dehydrogenase-like predicted oxidoreductase
MARTALGRTGLSVSKFCLGSMQFGWTADERQSFAVMDAFAAAGGNFIDTADIYSRWHDGNAGGESEEIIGRWMKARGNRAEIVVATKARGPMWDGPEGEGLSRSHIIRAAEHSLKRLQVETIDLYQFHWFDEKTPIEESLRAIEDLAKEGKIRFAGASNYPPARLREALKVATDHCLPAFATLQPHHNLVHRKEFEDGLRSICHEHDLAVIPYSPLAGGFLTGKYTRGGEAVRSARAGGVKRYFSPDGWGVLDAVRDIASAYETTCSAVALAWQMAQPGITAPIVGANTPGQLEEQLPALTLELSSHDLARLNTASGAFLLKGDAHPGR